MKITNIGTLGTVYNIVSEDGELLKAIKIIRHDEILKSAVGEYSDDNYATFDDYISAAHCRLSGFIKNPLDVYWYRTTEDDFELMNIIDTCVEQNYEYAIVDIQ